MKILDNLIDKVKELVTGSDKPDRPEAATPRAEDHRLHEADLREPGYGSLLLSPEEEDDDGEIHTTMHPIDRPLGDE